MWQRIRATIMDQRNYYDVLGVDKEASVTQIKESFRKLALQYHPDRNQNDHMAQSRMQQINEAYAVLSDPDKRRQYDLMYGRYGDAAQARFRQTYSAQDLFNGSDIQQIFEELSRAFGVRGFDAIFNDLHHKRRGRVDLHGPGGDKNTVFGGIWYASGAGQRDIGWPGKLAQNILRKLTGIQLPARGDDIFDTIALGTDDALRGGPYAYYLSVKDKKLVVHIPPGIKDNQKIRLAGMGHDGSGGAEAGDLMLKVKIRGTLSERLKQCWDSFKRSLKQ